MTEHYDRRALTDAQRALADEIASAMSYGHADDCQVWWEEPDGCSCPLLLDVADGLAGARIVEVTQEFGYDPATRRGDRLHRHPFLPHPLTVVDKDIAERWLRDNDLYAVTHLHEASDCAECIGLVDDQTDAQVVST